MSETYAICPECGLRFDTPDVDTRIAELEATILANAQVVESEMAKDAARIAELEAENRDQQSDAENYTAIIGRQRAEIQRLRDEVAQCAGYDDAAEMEAVLVRTQELLRRARDIITGDVEDMGGEDNYHYDVATVAKINAALEDTRGL